MTDKKPKSGGVTRLKATDKQIGQALEETKGLVTLAAKRLGMTARAVHLRIARSNKLQDMLSESRELGKDMAEIQLFKAIQSGDMRSVRWFLERRAKDRGYFRQNAMWERIERLESLLEQLEARYRNG